MDVSLSSLPQIIDSSQPRRAHLVGIAGSGMRALADVLLGWGWLISGSDLDIASFASHGGADILVCRESGTSGRQEGLPH